MSSIELVDKLSIKDFRWPDNESSRLAFHFMLDYITNGTSQYINNANHEVALAVIDNEILPLVINHGNGSSFYLTSPYVNYIEYAKDFIASLNNTLIRKLLLWLTRLITVLVNQKHIDKVIYINHWMTATGPQLCLSIEQINLLLKLLKNKYGAYVFKGVRKNKLDDLISNALQKNFHYIFNRQIYLWYFNDFKKSSEFKSDRSLLKRNANSLETTSKIDHITADRLCELYKKIYFEKYSNYSGDYTPLWFIKTLAGSSTHTCITKQNEVISSFITYFRYGDELIASITGHDPALSKQYGLYRLGVAYLMALAEKEKLILNLSSGSGKFKLNRGSKKVLEYELVCFKHLPLNQRISWRLICFFYNVFGIWVFSILDI